MLRRLRVVKLVLIVSLFILAATTLWINSLRAKYVLPILMYHSINIQDNPKDPLVVKVTDFQRQMEFLKKHNYNVISLEDAAELIRGKSKVPPKTIVITFDDGLRNNYTYAFGILKNYNFPATIFVIVDEIGRARGDKLSWEELEDLQASGLITVGSHALGGEPLVNLKSTDEIRRQVFESKKILEERLGKKINCFSYPEGKFSSFIRQAVIDAGYMLAVTTNPGRKFVNDDVFCLKRLRVGPRTKNLFTFWVVASGYYNAMRESKRK